MADIGGQHIMMTVDFATGLSITGIRDQVTRHPFLTQSSLFAFAADNGPLRESATGVAITDASYTPTSALTLRARALEEPLTFTAHLTCGANDSAVLVRLSVTNSSGAPVFLRLVMPVVRGLTTPGEFGRRRIVVPQEIGSVVSADGGPAIGMPLNLDVGLPPAMNSLEVACLYNADGGGGGGGGVFFADVDGDPEQGVAPLQLIASESDVTGFWIATIAPGATVSVPRLAIGVHHGGDWHDAIDFYTAHHRPRWRFTETPAWLRDQGAIYAFAGGGAGGILMAHPIASLSDGAVMTTWQKDDGPWRDAIERLPVQISTAGLATAGGSIAVIARGDQQVDVFVVGDDGAIWTTWERDDGPWRDGRKGRQPVRISPPCFAPRGAQLAVAHQQDGQIDVFVVGHDGAIWVTWQKDDSPWQDGIAGRLPRRITPAGLAKPGAHLAAIHQNEDQLDVFVVGVDGAVWVTWTVGDQPWTDGEGGRMPVRITPVDFAKSGSPLAAALQNESQLDVFVRRKSDGAIWVTWTVNNGVWTDGLNGRSPAPVTPPDFAPEDAHIAAALQSTNQLDVFVVRNDGAIWVTWEVDDGPWTDGRDGREPKPITPIDPVPFIPPGAPLSAILQSDTQLNVLFATGGAIWATWEVGNAAWRDGVAGRPRPVPVSTFNFTPPAASIATVRRSTGQLDAFVVGNGRIRSFRELPRLLAEAQELGTNVVYLFDYWEGVDEGGYPPYWNKGDYFLRSDLGGEAAFIDGVQGIHAAGGRIIVYVEPFIIYQHSEIARAKAEAWGARWPHNGSFHTHYPDNKTMMAPFGAWQEYITSVCERLVCLCKVDGIFLDSYGWQMNWPMIVAEDGRPCTPAEHVRGVLQLADHVRATIRRYNPNAVVLGETSAGPIGRHWDGGLSAEFAWDRTIASSRDKLLGSPIRYAAPEVSFYSNGRDLAQLHQVFAAGHGLALSSLWESTFMHTHRAHIRALVKIRQQCKDALISGPQEYQPQTTNDAVVAYFYRGAEDQILTIVNTVDLQLGVDIHLRQTETNAVWQDLLDPDVQISTDITLLANVALAASQQPGGIRVLLRVG